MQGYSWTYLLLKLQVGIHKTVSKKERAELRTGKVKYFVQASSLVVSRISNSKMFISTAFLILITYLFTKTELWRFAKFLFLAYIISISLFTQLLHWNNIHCNYSVTQFLCNVCRHNALPNGDEQMFESEYEYVHISRTWNRERQRRS
jgi:hypothetical protein